MILAGLGISSKGALAYRGFSAVTSGGVPCRLAGMSEIERC